MIWFLFCALYNLAFAIFHLTFWKLLNWKDELQRVSANNRAVMQTLNLCLTFVFFLAAYLYFFHSDDNEIHFPWQSVRGGHLSFLDVPNSMAASVL